MSSYLLHPIYLSHALLGSAPPHFLSDTVSGPLHGFVLLMALGEWCKDRSGDQGSLEEEADKVNIYHRALGWFTLYAVGTPVVVAGEAETQ